MTEEVRDLIAREAKAAEDAETSDDPPRAHTMTRRHGRSRTLQVRLNPDEYDHLEQLATARGLPVSTVARTLLLSMMQPADDLRAAVERLERDVLDVRRQLGA